MFPGVYYVFKGPEPDCANAAAMICVPGKQSPKTPGIWNPLPYFEDVHQDAQLGNIQSLSHFFAAAHKGSLPAVSWIVPNGRVSEHPPALVSRGETYVTTLINSIEKPRLEVTPRSSSHGTTGAASSTRWSLRASTRTATGCASRRVISPYAKRGFIDHQVLSLTH